MTTPVPKPSTSKVFCMAPWVHMHVWPNGNTYACCLHPPDNVDDSLGNIKVDGLAKVWNGDNMRRLRVNMLNEQKTPEVCTRCYQKEDSGFSSLRSWMNDYFYEKHSPIVASTDQNGEVEKFNLVHWDFRFSNICNLKCRTCGHELSSQWYDDFLKEFPSARSKQKLIRIVERNDPMFWDLLEGILPDVESIHFAGGEPLLMEEHYKVLALLHKHRKFDIAIHYSTNATILTYKDIDLIKEWAPFKLVVLSLSLDGYGKHFDIIRKNGKWEKVEENLRIIKLANLSNLSARVHYTASVLNIMHLPDFHRYMIEHELFNKLETGDQHWMSNFMINPVISPAHYSFSALPSDVRNLVIQKLYAHITYLTNYCGISATGIETLIEAINSTVFNQHDLDEFQRVTATVDVIRGERLLDVIPELVTMISK